MANKIFNEIAAEYERDRAEAARKADARRAEVYAKIPRVKEIDEETAKLGAALLKDAVSPKGRAAALAAFAARNEALKKEKRELMRSAGFSADYAQRVYKCAACRDYGYLEDGGPRCKCMIKKLIEKRYAISGLSATLEKENFSTFDITLYSDATDSVNGVSPRKYMAMHKKACEDFVRNFGGEPKNLFLYGEAGLGKTFMCNCITKALIDAGYTVLYQSAARMFKRLEDIRFSKSRDDWEDEDEFTKLLINCDLLIIDDFGTEMKTIVTMSDFFDIINTRALNSKPVVISSNLKLNDIKNEYSERIYSRIMGDYDMLRFFGKDIRELKKYSLKTQ